MSGGSKRKRVFQTYASKDKLYRKVQPRRVEDLQRSSLAKEQNLFATLINNNDMFCPGTDNIDLDPPKRPRPQSQKEATMAVQPNDEDVGSVSAVTGCSREQAVKYLKAKQNDVEKAVNALLDGEDITEELEASTWDEGAFSANREGNQDDNNGNLRPLGMSAVPTRGNSPAGSYRQPASKDEEDADLARAIKASQGIHTAFQQESGVIGPDGTSKPTFGPANRSDYDKSQWSMVTYQADSSEIIPDVDAEHRKYVPGEPRFLKHLPSGDYLPNFLTICHAIPLAREALFLRNHVMPRYGQDPEWWRGHAISMPKLVHTVDGSPALPIADRQDELIAETQRLMAFLDVSERLYASGALTQTAAVDHTLASSTRSRTSLELYIREWIAAASAKSEYQGEMASLFTTTVGTTALEGMDTPYMHLVDLAVDSTGETKSDLAEMLDNLLWETDSADVTSENYIGQPAEVLVMRADRQSASKEPLRLEVPAEFYVDKYLRQNMEGTRGMRRRIAGAKERVAKIEAVERKLTTWKHPTKNEQIDAKKLLQHSLGHFSGQNRRGSAQVDNSKQVMVDGETDAETSYYADTAQKLDRVINSIDEKLSQLALTKEQTRKAISEMSKARFAGAANTHRYTLRGVATKPHITYILCPKESDEDVDMPEEAGGDETPAGMQWWRIQYDVSGSKTSIDKLKCPDYDVLRAVELEHSSALLVYASDEACNPARSDPSLPMELHNFIQDDNALFATELQSAVENRAPPAYDLNDDVPLQSIEGRSSLDSTVAVGGDSPSPTPPDYSDDVYMQQHHGFGLGYDIKQGVRMEEEDEAEVAEIKLDDEEEIVERDHAPYESGGGGDAQTESAGGQDDRADGTSMSVDHNEL